MDSGLRVTVDARELTDLARALGRAADGPELKKRLRAELRIEANRLIPPIRAAIAAIPSKGQSARRGRPQLRMLMARSVSTQIKTGKWAGVRVFMNPRKMPNGMKALPGYFEGIAGKERLRHPVFGHDRWVTQRTSPYFGRGATGAEAKARAAVERVMNDIAKEIE